MVLANGEPSDLRSSLHSGPIVSSLCQDIEQRPQPKNRGRWEASLKKPGKCCNCLALSENRGFPPQVALLYLMGK